MVDVFCFYLSLQMSDSEEEEVRSWTFERFVVMIRGRGVSTEISEMEVGDLLKFAGVGRGVPLCRGGVRPGGVVTLQQNPEKSRLVREEASEESPVAASQKPEMPPVQEVPVAASLYIYIYIYFW